ncbi:serine hydrolase [Desulfotalea psychrophila]|nr:serine hydrolase [Desulfotalea psychrophila]
MNLTLYKNKPLQLWGQCFFLFFLFVVALPQQVFAAEKYNIVYLLTDDIDLALDYKDDIEPVLGTTISDKLRIVSKGKKYAVIYNGGDSSQSVASTLVKHVDLLEKAGFDQPYASMEQGFSRLYNVSYGMGPNIDALKRTYNKVYATLGEDVGRNLFIEKTAKGNYTLIYRRRGTKKSTSVVARRHGRILRLKKIRPSITQENNNEVVFGESSLLDEDEEKVVVVKGERTVMDVLSAPQVGDEIVIVQEKNILPLSPALPGLPSIVFPAEKIKLQAVKKVYIAKVTGRGKRVHKTVSSTLRVKRSSSRKVEKSIEAYIAKLRQKGKISRDEATGWMVFDLATGESIVDINANRKFQTASMIKPFVALAFFHKVQAGQLTYGPRSRRNMTAMIQRSSNSSTNWVMRQVGGPRACEAILTKYYPQIFKGIELKEYIPAGGRTYKNRAYPSDYVRFLRELWDRKLPHSKEMRRLMALPGRDRLYFGTPIPRGTLVYNKTGSTAHLCGDMGILVPKTRSGSRYPYVIVGIIEKKSRSANYGAWVASRSKVIRQVSTLVYREMKKEHRLR